MDAKYYQEHREEIRTKQKLHYEKNKEKYAARNKRWRSDNRDKIASYLDGKKDVIHEQGKAWRSKNKSHLALKQRQYRAEKPEIVKRIESKRVITDERRAKANAYRKEWRAKNPDKEQQYYQKRRAIKVGGDLTESEILEQRKLQQGKCHYCGSCLDNNGRGHIDHKTPLSRGGRNTKSNIVIACSNCNLNKGIKTEEEYFEYLSNRSRERNVSLLRA